MKKEYLFAFRNLFVGLFYIDELIKNNSSELKNLIQGCHEDIYEIITQSFSNSYLFSKLTAEIESNLFEYPNNRITYLKLIIREFHPINSLFENYSNRVYSHLVNDKDYNQEYNEASAIKKYILDCHLVYLNFWFQIDKLCIDFDINIMEVQKDIEIIVYKRDASFLQKRGYKTPNNQLQINKNIELKEPKEDNTKNIKNNLISQLEIINEFVNFNIIKNNENRVNNYLDDIKKTIDLSSKKMTGNVCLTLFDYFRKDIFKKKHKNMAFAQFVELLCNHWKIDPPKDKRPSKYQKLNEYSILEKKIF